MGNPGFNLKRTESTGHITVTQYVEDTIKKLPRTRSLPDLPVVETGLQSRGSLLSKSSLSTPTVLGYEFEAQIRDNSLKTHVLQSGGLVKTLNAQTKIFNRMQEIASLSEQPLSVNTGLKHTTAEGMTP